MTEVTFGLIILLIIAGMGAGIVTGLAGASAATVVTPLLISFSDIDPYTAIAFALITDVFASFFSYLTYKKNGNINIKDGMYLTVAACIGAIIGSYISTFMGDGLGVLGRVITCVLGLSFLIRGYKLRKSPVDTDTVVEKPKSKLSKYNPNVVSSILGLILGVICGIVGAGGGLMILFVLTSILNYDTKVAIGTSVLIMTFTALTGGVSHILHIEVSNYAMLFAAMAVSSVAGIVGAKVAAAFANKTTEDVLLMIVGSTFLLLTVFILGINLLV